MSNNKKEEKLGLFFRFKTFLTSSKGIFQNNPSRIRTKIDFIDFSNFNPTDRKTYYLFRTENNDIKKYLNHADNAKEKRDNMFSIKFDNGIYILNSLINENLLLSTTENNINVIKNKIWYIVNNNEKKNDDKDENEDYYIIQGDIIKLGKELYIFSEIKLNISEEKKETIIYDINSLNRNRGFIFDICSQPKVLNKKNYCEHIVNDLEGGKDSPKFKEIKNWIEEYRLKNSQTQKVKKYPFSLKICEKCNKFYPLRYKLKENSEVIEFIELDKPKENYIILESVEELEDIDKQVIKTFYVIELTGEDETIRIGRNNDNDVILSSKDISRYHSIIKYSKNKRKLIIKNLSDSSGTMVLIKTGFLQISDKRNIYLQSGTTFFETKVIKEEEYKKIEEEYKKENDKKHFDVTNNETKSPLEKEMEENSNSKDSNN